MKKSTLRIQCKYPTTGKIGSFLASETGPDSPLFPDCYELFQWCRLNGWEQDGPGLHMQYVKP